MFGTVILKKIDKLRFKKEIEFMKTAKIYFATILSLMFCSGLVSQSAADSMYYAKLKKRDGCCSIPRWRPTITKRFEARLRKRTRV